MDLALHFSDNFRLGLIFQVPLLTVMKRWFYTSCIFSNTWSTCKLNIRDVDLQIVGNCKMFWFSFRFKRKLNRKRIKRRCPYFELLLFLSAKTKYYKSQTMEQWQLYSQYFISQYICLLVLMYLFVLKEQRNCISRVVSVSRNIILFNTGLYKSPFSTNSFGKLVFCLSALFASCQIRCNLHKLYNICMTIRCQVHCV